MMFAVIMIAKQSEQRYTPFFFFEALSHLEFYLIFITSLRNRASCSFNHIEGEFFLFTFLISTGLRYSREETKC